MADAVPRARREPDRDGSRLSATTRSSRAARAPIRTTALTGRPRNGRIDTSHGACLRFGSGQGRITEASLEALFACQRAREMLQKCRNGAILCMRTRRARQCATAGYGTNTDEGVGTAPNVADGVAVARPH